MPGEKDRQMMKKTEARLDRLRKEAMEYVKSRTREAREIGDRLAVAHSKEIDLLKKRHAQEVDQLKQQLISISGGEEYVSVCGGRKPKSKKKKSKKKTQRGGLKKNQCILGHSQGCPLKEDNTGGVQRCSICGGECRMREFDSKKVVTESRAQRDKMLRSFAEDMAELSEKVRLKESRWGAGTRFRVLVTVETRAAYPLTSSKKAVLITGREFTAESVRRAKNGVIQVQLEAKDGGGWVPSRAANGSMIIAELDSEDRVLRATEMPA